MTQNGWKHLGPHPQSSYKQLFLKGTRLRAEWVYARVVDGDPPEGLTPEEIAEDMNLPLEAVREAIAYCEADPPEIREDHARERASMREIGWIDAEAVEQGAAGAAVFLVPAKKRAQFRVAVPGVVVRWGLFKGRPPCAESLLQPALWGESLDQIVARPGVIGIEHESLAEFGDGAIQIVAFLQGPAQMGLSVGILRIEFDGPAEFADSAAPVADIP